MGPPAGKWGKEEGYGVQSLADMGSEWERLNSNNYEDDDSDCSRDNCLSDFGGIVVEIMFSICQEAQKLINVNSN